MFSIEGYYMVNKSSSEYPMRVLARWLRKADHLPRFHYFRTVETIPETICLHATAAQPATAKEIAAAKK